MRKFFGILVGMVLIGTALVFASGEGKITNGQPTEQCWASMADWYTMKSLNISGASGNIVISTTYSGLICKGFINRSGSTALVKCITVAGDTNIVPIAAYSQTGKMPPMLTIFKTGTSDSLILLFQKR